MAGDSLFVDPVSLDDFGTYLQARLDEAHAARLAMTTAGSSTALGGFEDAARTAARLDTLRRGYLERLDRLIGALTAAQAAAATIARRYRAADTLATGADHG